MTDQDRVKIFDTTLRDGEQSPGATLTSNEKLEIARQLEQAGDEVERLIVVDVEPDGSAYFEVPAGKMIFLQALDAVIASVRPPWSAAKPCRWWSEPRSRPTAAPTCSRPIPG